MAVVRAADMTITDRDLTRIAKAFGVGRLESIGGFENALYRSEDNRIVRITHTSRRSVGQVEAEFGFMDYGFDQDDTGGHERPVKIYRVDDGRWSPAVTVEARVTLEPALLNFGEYSIDRRDRRWLNTATGEAAGYCARLPLWESIAIIQARAPGAEE